LAVVGAVGDASLGVVEAEGDASLAEGAHDASISGEEAEAQDETICDVVAAAKNSLAY
jgi:hypothetical protein